MTAGEPLSASYRTSPFSNEYLLICNVRNEDSIRMMKEEYNKKAAGRPLPFIILVLSLMRFPVLYQNTWFALQNGTIYQLFYILCFQLLFEAVLY